MVASLPDRISGPAIAEVRVPEFLGVGSFGADSFGAALETKAHVWAVPIAALSSRVAQLAQLALVVEPCVWPRFGLVGPVSTGSHDDMSYPMLVGSAVALAPFYAGVTKRALRRGRVSFREMRRDGRHAERVMLAATGGVNTHKGAIFLLGLLAAAWGQEYARRRSAVPITALLATAHRAAAPDLFRDLDGLRRRFGETYGEHAYRRYGWRGARGVVLDGLRPLAVGTGALAQCGASWGAAWLRLAFLASSEDTNLLRRVGWHATQEFRGRAARLVASDPAAPETWRAVRHLERDMESRRASAAAAGDLLAATLFLSSLERHGLVYSH